MKIFLTNELSDALASMSNEYVKFFISRIDQIKDLNKTELFALDSVIKLQDIDKINMYAYFLEESSYVLFASLPQKKILLVDIVTVVDKNTLTSLVFKKNISENNDIKM